MTAALLDTGNAKSVITAGQLLKLLCLKSFVVLLLTHATARTIGTCILLP